MEIGRHGAHPGKGYIIGQRTVCATQPLALGAHRIAFEMGDLCAGVDTRIGTTCADDLDGLIRDPAERALNRSLNGRRTRLALPAPIGAAVVFDSAGEAAQTAA